MAAENPLEFSASVYKWANGVKEQLQELQGQAGTPAHALDANMQRHLASVGYTVDEVLKDLETYLPEDVKEEALKPAPTQATASKKASSRKENT
jgi:hypothetical protein